MSRGHGVVQQGIIMIFEREPNARYTVDELAAALFPDEVIERKHKESVRRALKTLENSLLPLSKARIGRSKHRGWHLRVGRL